VKAGYQTFRERQRNAQAMQALTVEEAARPNFEVWSKLRKKASSMRGGGDFIALLSLRFMSFESGVLKLTPEPGLEFSMSRASTVSRWLQMNGDEMGVANVVIEIPPTSVEIGRAVAELVDLPHRFRIRIGVGLTQEGQEVAVSLGGTGRLDPIGFASSPNAWRSVVHACRKLRTDAARIESEDFRGAASIVRRVRFLYTYERSSADTQKAVRELLGDDFVFAVQWRECEIQAADIIPLAVAEILGVRHEWLSAGTPLGSVLGENPPGSKR
jgi:hypothetical protein